MRRVQRMIVEASVLLAATGFLPVVAVAADAPGFAKKPVIVEYDLDPSWPKRPDHIEPGGWVSGMAIDKEDRVWVFGRGKYPVQVYTAGGDFVRTWGKDHFKDPHHIRLDHDGNVWVADFGLHVVEKYTPEGKLLMTLGTMNEKGEDETHFYRPTDMAITPSGDIFVTDGYGNRRIVHLDRNGTFIKAWGRYGSGPGEFVLPHAIGLDSRGMLYVCDRNSGRIQLFNQDGKQIDQWSNMLMPWGISIARDDRIWVCGSSPHWWKRHGKYPEYTDQLFMRLSTDGRVQQLWVLPLGEDKNVKPGETRGVHCIVEDSRGNIYIGDIYGERAQKFVAVRERPVAASK